MDKRFCIFDMDGTLVDSMDYWHGLQKDYIMARGVAWDEKIIELVERLRPMTLVDAGRELIRELGFTGTPQSIADDMNAIMHENYRLRVPLKDGADAYLAALKGRGAKLCTASATDVPLVKTCLERLGIAGYFDFMLSCEEVGRSKDCPDVYFEAARRLGAQPSEIAVFEDSLVALKTAKDAGFHAVAVADSANAAVWEKLCGIADETVTDWEEAAAAL